MKLSKQQIENTERIMMRHRNQPIPHTQYLYGEEVIWVAGGWADVDSAQLYDIVNNKALIYNTNCGPIKYRWVPLKHIYKKKVEE
jgi:hypothetical protein